MMLMKIMIITMMLRMILENSKIKFPAFQARSCSWNYFLVTVIVVVIVELVVIAILGLLWMRGLRVGGKFASLCCSCVLVLR